MKRVTGSVNSAKPISLSKASTLLSGFVSSETQASQDVSAYLRRAFAAFTELRGFHREIRSANPNSEARHPKEDENVIDEKVNVKLEEEINEKKKKSKKEDDIDEKQRNEERKEKKNRKSDGEIGSEERKIKKKRKSKEIDA